MAEDPVTTEKRIEEFKARKKRQLFTLLPLLIILALSVMIKDGSDSMPLGLSEKSFSIMIVLIVAGVIVFSLKNWRCPACNAYLGKGFNPKFCPKCGSRLQ
jgi:hypothetical protein